jgi:hypothetical protein
MRQIADALGVKGRLLGTLMRLDGFPAVRLNGKGTWLSTRASLERWFEARIRRLTGAPGER